MNALQIELRSEAASLLSASRRERARLLDQLGAFPEGSTQAVRGEAEGELSRNVVCTEGDGRQSGSDTARGGGSSLVEAMRWRRWMRSH